VLFANYRVTMVEDKGRARAFGGKERVLYGTHSTTHDAKNRCGIPERVPFTIQALAPLFDGMETAGAPANPEVIPSNTSNLTSPSKPVESALSPHPLDKVLAEIDQVLLTNFLVNRGQIKAGESYRNVSEAYAKRILETPAAFLKCVGATGSGLKN
jgi:hypothetical protein